MECDGKCGSFTVCPSKAPPSRRDNEPQCAAGRTMCGVPGASTGQPWKCVDVTTDPTTCKLSFRRYVTRLSYQQVVDVLRHVLSDTHPSLA